MSERKKSEPIASLSLSLSLCFGRDLVEDARIIGTCLVTGHGAGAAAGLPLFVFLDPFAHYYPFVSSGNMAQKTLSAWWIASSCNGDKIIY